MLPAEFKRRTLRKERFHLGRVKDRLCCREEVLKDQKDKGGKGVHHGIMGLGKGSPKRGTAGRREFRS